MSNVRGKVAVITGGAQGIGLAAAKKLLQHYAKVIILDLDEDKGKSSCAALQAEFGEDSTKFYKTDVTNMEDLEAAFSRAKKEFGAIDILINNAGVLELPDRKKIVDINLTAVITGTFLGIDYMSTQKGGKGGTIINMSSLAGLVPTPVCPVYGATKHGVIGFTRSMTPYASSDSVRINCICPTFVRTRMMKLDQAGYDRIDHFVKVFGMMEPEAVADVVLELIADDSRAGAVVLLTEHDKKYMNLLDVPDFSHNEL